MLLLDPREGSRNYAAPLRSLGLPVDDSAQFDFGDVAFWASNRAIGIELKKFDDMLLCVTTGRFAGHQLPGLVQTYDEVYLIVEGLWRPNPADGVLEQWRGSWVAAGRGQRRWMWREFAAYLTTIEVRGGIRVCRTVSEDETARMVANLYDWWGRFDEHHSHLARYKANQDSAMFVRPTFAHRVASEIEGIGTEKASDIAAAFPTVRAMVGASEKDWRKVKGVGKVLAKRIVEGWDSAA